MGRFGMLLFIGLGAWVIPQTGSEDGKPASRETDLLSAGQESCGLIAYASDRDGNFNIYTSPVEGGPANQLTFYSGDRAEYAPSWSPVADRIAFVSYGNGWRISVMESDGTDRHPLDLSPNYRYMPAWSPNGNQVAVTQVATDIPPFYQGSMEIFVLPEAGGPAKRLTDDPRSSLEWGPDWSPDGSRLLFTSNRDGNLEVYAITLEGGEALNLSDHGGADFGASWSPDGSSVAFYSDRDGTYAIYVMNPDGSQIRRMADGSDKDAGLTDRDPIGLILAETGWRTSWSPDGREIAYVAEDDTDTEIFVVSVDGGTPRAITSNDANDGSPAWCRTP